MVTLIFFVTFPDFVGYLGLWNLTEPRLGGRTPRAMAKDKAASTPNMSPPSAAAVALQAQTFVDPLTSFDGFLDSGFDRQILVAMPN